jgi:hypothetical protein
MHVCTRTHIHKVILWENKFKFIYCTSTSHIYTDILSGASIGACNILMSDSRPIILLHGILENFIPLYFLSHPGLFP